MFETLLLGGIIGGGVLDFFGNLQEGSANAAAAEFNAEEADRTADLLDQNAALAISQSQKQKARFEVAARKTMGRMRTAYGASGVTMEGSPSEVMAESQAIAEEDALLILHQGIIQSAQFKAESKQLRRKAEMLRGQAGSYRTAGILGAVGSVLSTSTAVGKAYARVN